MVLRKRDITNFYKKRDELTIEEAEHLFCNNQILSTIDEKFRDGLKLCVYLLVEKLGPEKSWELIRKYVVKGNSTMTTCLNIGTVLQKAYKDALETNPGEEIVTRSEVANSIFKPLLEHCILVKRVYSEKFCSILRAIALERDGPMSKMLFDISTRVVWRYLSAPNAHIRMGAYYVQVNVFPPISDDPICNLDYTNKHCEAFIKALTDPVIDICLQAIEGVCEVVSVWFSEITEIYLDRILNELVKLASDENSSIRAAVYHGLRHFHECAKGVLKFEAMLKHICKKGIDDPSERVRCNVFRLLNSIVDMKIKLLSPMRADFSDQYVLTLEDVLYRLDCEESEAVEVEIARFVFLNIFDKPMANENRYKAVNHICRISRKAGLDFHRLLHACKITSVEYVLSHIFSVLTVCLNMLSKVVEKRDQLANGNESAMDETNATVTTNVGNSFDMNRALRKIKDVIDCMVVCFSTLRYDPAFNSDLTESQMAHRLLVEISSKIITEFELTHPELVDSAFAIISLVRSAGMHAAKIKYLTTRYMCAGQMNVRYLEVFALTQMEDLLKFLQEGLGQFESITFPAENTPSRKRRSNHNSFQKPKIIVEAIMELMKMPSCSQYIVEKYDHYLSSFCNSFDRICDNFMLNLANNREVDMETFIECWQLRAVLIIIKFNREAFVSSKNNGKGRAPVQSRNTPARRTSAIILSEIEAENRVDPLVEECGWMSCRISSSPELSGNAELVEEFYQTVELHLKAYKHKESAINLAMSLVKKMYKLGEEHPRNKSIVHPYKSCLKAGERALEFAEPDMIALEPLTEEVDMEE